MRNNSNETDLIGNRLRAERPNQSAPAGFTDRVMDHLPGPAGAPAHRAARVLPRFAFGLAAFVVGAFVILQWARYNQYPPAVPELAAASAVTASESLEINLPEIPSGHFQALSIQLDEPLEKELQNVISDTRQAIQFVAANFLPEK